jgi:hypothetical protein
MEQEQREIFARNPEAVEKLLGFGETKAEATLPRTELAASTVVAQALLNLDDTLMRR